MFTYCLPNLKGFRENPRPRRPLHHLRIETHPGCLIKRRPESRLSSNLGRARSSPSVKMILNTLSSANARAAVKTLPGFLRKWVWVS